MSKDYYQLCRDYNIEVFHNPDDYDIEHYDVFNSDDTLQDGWYWWSCSPGCLPDGDPNGPFDSEIEAQEDAVEPYLSE